MNMADKKTINEINESSSGYNDEAIAAEEKAKREAQKAEDLKKPYDPEALLEVRHLQKSFPIKKSLTGKVLQSLVAVDDVSFTLKAGETLGIVGESGCGKTTLGRTILKLHQSNGGQIIFDGKDITDYKTAQMRDIRTKMQIIFQDPYSSLPPRSTVGDILSEPVKVHNIVPKSEVRDYVLDLMEKCGLRDYYYERYPHEFSGGQRQRICIARALSVNPQLVVCDEPVSALDVSIQAQVINMFGELQEKLGLSYLFIAHDLLVVRHISHRIAVMYLGKIVEMAEANEIYDHPLHPYSKALISAVPIPDPNIARANQRIALGGDIPSPLNAPSGCPFRTRCPRATAACAESMPEFKELSKGHFVACHNID